MAINHVAISGYLTRDPEIRRTQGGMSIMSFGIAINEQRHSAQTDEWEDAPVFVDCTMFGKRSESVSDYISKGSKVSIDGKLRYSTWEKNGQKHSKLEVIVNEIEFMSKGEAKPQKEPKPQQDQIPSGVYDDDIPF